MRSPEGPEPSPGRRWWLEEPDGTGVCQALEVRPVHAERTAYQELAIWDHPWLGRVLTLDGVVQTTQADEFVYHEMLVHVPLLGAAVRRCETGVDVLIVGGGDGGTLREVLVHPWVRRAVMVEIDERVVAVCREHLGIHGDYGDPRVELVIGDGTAFVADPANRGAFDVVLVDSTDPGGPSEPLFGEAFTAGALACLRPGGVFARQMGVPFYQPFLREAAASLGSVFGGFEIYRTAVPTYIGGDMAFLAAVAGGGTIARPLAEYTGRHYTPALHRAAFAIPPWWTGGPWPTPFPGTGLERSGK